MDLILIGSCLAAVIWLYFSHNPLSHDGKFLFRRFVNWFPLGMTYAFLYMGRYNLNVCKNALGQAISNVEFGWIFGAGTVVYATALFINGPLVDKIGGKKGIVISALGAALANAAMGLATYLYLHDRLPFSLPWTLAVLYSVNMFFQSYGAVSIIKVKAYWFHVRERGMFGAIFGSLISFGVYFAFDWGTAIVNASKAHIQGEPTTLQRIFQLFFAVDTGSTDATWLVFFIPSAIMVFWALLDMWLIKDTPEEAGFEAFDTHDASSGEMDREYSSWQTFKRILANPIILTVAFVEFTSGVLRNGIMQWYFIFGAQVPQIGAEFFKNNWGLLNCMTGIAGGFLGGIVSDKMFHSRRGPPAALFGGIMFVSLVTMAAVLFTSPFLVGLCCSSIVCFVIGVHSLMSGTAAADFGGRKATATASGIADGFVYLGTGLQSVSLGYITSVNWQLWPIFLAPFALLGTFLAIRIWRDLPEATRRYLIQVEKISVSVSERETFVQVTKTSTEVIRP